MSMKLSFWSRKMVVVCCGPPGELPDTKAMVWIHGSETFYYGFPVFKEGCPMTEACGPSPPFDKDAASALFASMTAQFRAWWEYPDAVIFFGELVSTKPDTKSG